jgi:hypothetical protein
MNSTPSPHSGCRADPLRDRYVLRDPVRNLRAILMDGAFVRNALAEP